MNGKFILDSNIIINLFRGDAATIQLISTLSDLYVPSIVLGELYFGAHKSKFTAKHISQIETLKATVTILSVDELTSGYYGEIKNYLKQKGKPIPENDIWIAAIVKQTGFSLISGDKHFADIPDIQVMGI